MKQQQIISHALLSLMLLTSGSIYGCRRQDSPPTPTASAPSPPEAKIDPLKTSLGEAQKQLKLVKTYLDTMNSGLGKFVTEGGSDIDFGTIKSQWQDFKKKWEITKGQLDSQNEVKSKLSSLNLLEDKIKSFDTTIGLLNTDIISQSKDKIKLLQKNLEMLLDSSASGKFGSLTQQILELKTKSDITEIELGLLQIEQAIGPSQQKQPTNPITPPPRKNNPIMNALLPLTVLLALGELGFIIYLLKRKKANTDTDIDTYSEKESPKLSAYERDMLPVLENENKQLRSKLSQFERQLRELESEKTALTQKNSLLENSNKNIQKPFLDIQPPKYPPEDRRTRENTAPPKHAAMIHRVNITTEDDLIAYYNSNPKVLEDSIEIVTASEESIQFKRIGGDMQIIFKNSRSGNYWLLPQPIIRDGYTYYCLVPKAQLVVNQHNYNTIRDIFNCTDYENRSSSKFRLKYAASVQKNQQGSWELIAPGEIVFS